MSEFNLSLLKVEAKKLEVQIADLQSRLNEMNLLFSLAEKYSLAAKPPNLLTNFKAVTGTGILQAVENAVVAGAGNTKKQTILDAANELLKDGAHRNSRWLLKEMTARGIQISGADESKQAAGLASYLSREDAFHSDIKAGGWTLKRLLKKARPDNAPTLPGPFTNGSQATHP